MASEAESPSSIRAGLEYLREQAFEAHLGGNGSRVVFLSTIALRTIERLETHDLLFSEYRWTVFLGYYWMASDDFHYVAAKAVERSKGDGEDSDGQLAEFLHDHIHRPPVEPAALQGPSLSDEWLDQSKGDPACSAAVSLAIEIAWYASPLTSEWEVYAKTLISDIGERSLMGASLQRLVARLRVQRNICLTGEEVTSDEILACTYSQKQRVIAEGWKLFFSGDHGALDELLSRTASAIRTTDIEHASFFYLSHFSRISRRSQEDQFIALERVRDATSSQPSRTVAARREELFLRNYHKLANQGFSKDSGTARWACLTASMLSQIGALRDWHLGEWITSHRNFFEIVTELASHGYPKQAKDGLVGLVASLHLPTVGKHPHVDHAFNLLDSLPATERCEFVSRLLSLPYNADYAAMQALARLSDAIPPEQLLPVAEWTVATEERNASDKFWKVDVEWWGDLLYCANNASELVAALKPLLLKKASEQYSWEDLETTLTASIMKGSDEDSREILASLLETRINPSLVSFDGSRETIVVNVAKNKSMLAQTCINWMQERTGKSRENFTAKWLRLIAKHIDHDWDKPFDDPAMREFLDKEVQETCDKRLAETGNSFSLYSRVYHASLEECSWPAPADALVEKLVETIEAEHVPYANKFDLLVCLGVLAAKGPSSQASLIGTHARKWLESGIPGRDVAGNGLGPLSTFRFSGMDRETINPGLWRLVTDVASNTDDLDSIQGLAEYSLSTGLRAPNNAVKQAFALALTLSLRASQQDKPLASSLAAIAESLAMRAGGKHMSSLLHAFHHITISKRAANGIIECREVWRETEARALTETFWSLRLQELAKSASAPVRRSVAAVTAEWMQLPDEIPVDLKNTLDLLSKDSRMTVRHACEMGV